MVRSEWSAIGRVGLSHHGPSYSSPGCESEKVLLGESDPDCYDAGEYDLSLSNDRRCHREAVQGCYVRSMGRVDGELRHANDSGWQLQGAKTDGLYQLGCASVEGIENHRCCEESEGAGHACRPRTRSRRIRRAEV